MSVRSPFPNSYPERKRNGGHQGRESNKTYTTLKKQKCWLENKVLWGIPSSWPQIMALKSPLMRAVKSFGRPGKLVCNHSNHFKFSTLIFLYRKGPRSVLRFFSIISMLSVMANTPKTFEDYPSMWYLTYVTDWITLVIFTAEMVTKIHHLGLISDEKSYLKDKWCKFDASMCFFIWISVILQVRLLLLFQFLTAY